MTDRAAYKSLPLLAASLRAYKRDMIRALTRTAEGYSSAAMRAAGLKRVAQVRATHPSGLRASYLVGEIHEIRLAPRFYLHSNLSLHPSTDRFAAEVSRWFVQVC